MPYSGIDSFIATLEKENHLIRISHFVDPILEVTEITDRMSKQPGGGKALLFENNGTPFPILTNAFGSDDRVKLALGIDSLERTSQRIYQLFNDFTAPKQTLLEKIKFIPKIRQIARWLPATVSGRGACQQVVHMEPDLNIIPILKCWPFDGGRFITLPMVNTRDPNTGIRNVGMYRMQVFGSKLTGMHWHMHKTGARHYSEYQKRGELMPVAVALGGDPVYTYSATAPLPDNIDEYLLAGFIREKRVKLVKCLTVDLEVPEDVDFVLEGYVNPQEELIWEGPFGDHTGFYSLADWFPKFHLTCITHRKNAVYPATIVGIPPMEDVYLAKATERIFLSPIRLALAPEVDDMILPIEGVAHNIAIVKITKSFPGQSFKVASALWGAGQMMFNKLMIVVNNKINLTDTLEIAKLVSKNVNPLRDIKHWYGPLDILDHATENQSIGGKLLVDATEMKNEENDSFFETVFDTESLLEKMRVLPEGITSVNTSLLHLGVSILLVSVDKSTGLTVKSMVLQIVDLIENNLPKFIVAVDKEVDMNNYSIVTWYVSGNVETKRDCFIVRSKGKVLPCLIVDGTRKSFPTDAFAREWPNIVTSDTKTIEGVDAKWNQLGLGAFVESPSRHFAKMTFGNSAILK